LFVPLTCSGHKQYALLQEDKARKVIVHVEKIFRGKHYENPVEIYSVSYKPDYRLIPKNEEQLWWDRLAKFEPRNKVVPGSIKLPPLMRVSKSIHQIILYLYLLQCLPTVGIRT